MCETRRGSHRAPAGECENWSPWRGQPFWASLPAHRGLCPRPESQPVGQSGPGTLPVAGRLTGFAGVLCLTCAPPVPFSVQSFTYPEARSHGGSFFPPTFPCRRDQAHPTLRGSERLSDFPEVTQLMAESRQKSRHHRLTGPRGHLPWGDPRACSPCGSGRGN